MVSPCTKARGSWTGCGIAERRRRALVRVVEPEEVFSQGRLETRLEVVERQRGLLCLNIEEEWECFCGKK
jgi:hypothetical protein